MRPRLSNPEFPKFFRHHHGGYYFVKAGKWTFLSRDQDEALAKHRKLVRPRETGLNGLIDDAIDSRRLTHKLKPNTVAQYLIAGEKLKHMLAQFTVPAQVMPRHIAQIKRSLATTPNMANRVLSVARIIFSYACSEQLIDSNPALGIEGHKESPRRRLISIEEFTAIRDKAVPRLQCAMDLLYLTGQRVEDVLQLRLADLKANGIYFEQDKTEARLVVAWTPELEAAVASAKALIRGVSGFTLLQGRHGKPVDYKTVYRQWNDACEAAKIEDAQMRDIRAMAATAIRAQGGNATALLGHTSSKMTERYLRDKTVPIVSGPSFVVPLIKRKKTA